MEDLDFSHTAYMKNPQSLFATPDATMIHKSSQEARRAHETVIYMTTRALGEWWGFIYLVISYFYAFKHIREITRRNLYFLYKRLNE